MRIVVLVLLALVLSGCADSRGDEEPAEGDVGRGEVGEPGEGGGGEKGNEGPSEQGGSELVVEVLDTVVSEAVPGGAGSIPFEVPEGYLELFVASPGEVSMEGLVRLWMESNNTHVLVDGAFSTTAGVDCGDCTWRFPATAGSWTLHWEVQGQLHIHVVVKAQ